MSFHFPSSVLSSKTLHTDGRNEKVKKRFFIFALIALFILSGCGREGPGDSPETAENIGRGDTVFRFEVTDDTETVTAWDVRTDETTVGAALSEVGLIKGEVHSEFGLFVTEVNGMKLEGNTYWALYIDGEYATLGVDSINIESGVTYAYVHTPF